MLCCMIRVRCLLRGLRKGMCRCLGRCDLRELGYGPKEALEWTEMQDVRHT